MPATRNAKFVCPETEPSLPARPGSYDDDYFDFSSLTERQIEILEIARHVFAQGGYAEFTMRKIAAAANMHLKSIQYHFSTKQELLSSMFSYVFFRYYIDGYDKIFAEKHLENPRERLVAALDFLLRDIAKNEFTARYYFELYALSMRDAEVEQLVNRMYYYYRGRFKDLILSMNPTLEAEAAADRATIIASITEGMCLFLSRGKSEHENADRVVNETVQRIVGLVLEP